MARFAGTDGNGQPEDCPPALCREDQSRRRLARCRSLVETRVRLILFLTVMATVATEKKRTPRATRAAKTPGRSQNAPKRRPTRARRGPSAHALEAHQAFAELQAFFGTKTALAAALGWSLPTLRGWFDSVPTRPREESIRDVIQLRDLAVAAGKWVSDPLQVGEWLLAPLAELRGSVPARLAVDLPPEGLSS
jgi:hypothetical protein